MDEVKVNERRRDRDRLNQCVNPQAEDNVNHLNDTSLPQDFPQLQPCHEVTQPCRRSVLGKTQRQAS